MVFYYLLLLCFAVLVATAFITQLISPALKGTRLFPAFGKERGEVVDEMSEALDQAELDEFLKFINELNEQHKAASASLNRGADAPSNTEE